MEINFETDNGRVFMFEVGFFDTIAEIKEKVEKSQHIPVDHQTLFYRTKRLCDDWDIQESLLFPGSLVQLRIADPNRQFQRPPPVRNRIQIILRAETGEGCSVQIGEDDTVESLKHIIARKRDGLAIDRIELRREFETVGMQNSKRIRDYNLMDGSELTLCQKTPSGTEHMKITLVLPDGKTGTMNLWGTDKIQEMRKKLDDAKTEMKFELPEKYYFLHCRSALLDEKGSLESNGIREGDTIEVHSSSSNKMEIHLILPNSEVLALSITRTYQIQLIRMSLERQKKDGKVELPEEYFFTHKQNVMQEKELLERLGVQEGDYIQILPGKAPSAPSSTLAPSSSPSSFSSKMMMIYFQLNNGNKSVFYGESTTKVKGTRIHLKKAKREEGFELPEPYFFIHEGSAMEEEQSLEAQGVQEGDTIYIFSGKVIPYSMFKR